MSDIKEKETRAGKADVIKYVSFILDMIAANATKREIVKALNINFNIQPQQATLYYLKACDQLEDDLNEKVASLRSKRIHGLQKDLREAYNEYLACENENVKVKWHEQYQRIKNQLDKYFPNELKHESERDALKIEIHYDTVSTPAKTKTDNEDE